MRHKLLLIIGLLFVCPKNFAQKPSAEEIDIDALIIKLFGHQNEDLDYEILYESLYQYYLHPIDINKANREELASLYLLTEYQINNFILYRDNLGPFIDIHELQAIPGFDIITIKQILPFVTIQESIHNEIKGLPSRIFSFKNSYFLVMNSRGLETKKGYIKDEEGTSAYKGSPWRTAYRFRNSRPGDFSIGFNLKKDPGEPIKWEPQKKWYGLDYISYHLAVYNKGIVKSLCIGDFQHQFGQGLVLSSGFNMGKGGETILTARRNNIGIRPYTSMLETGFFRGASTTLEVGPADITFFYSNRKIDGSLRDDSPEVDFYINSINTSGLHRTLTEQANRKTVKEQVLGGNISYRNRSQRLHIGSTVVGTKYNVPIVTNGVPYKAHEFTGHHNLTAGADYIYIFQNFNFFGEAAVSSNGRTGIVNGIISSLSNSLELSAVWRNYDANFHSFYSKAFGENYRNINEKGVYWGISWKPAKKWRFSGFYDNFRFPWMRYLVNGPSEGYEYFFRGEFCPSKKANLLIQFRSETKDRNLHTNTKPVNYPEPVKRENFLVNADINTSEKISLRTRVQTSRYSQKDYVSLGYTIIQDFNLNLQRVRFSTRFALFDTDDYNSRIYVYEKNVLYSFSFPAYYGRGIRTYLMTRFRLWKRNDLWFRYARTLYKDRNHVGSGHERTEGNSRTDFTVQFIYNF